VLNFLGVGSLLIVCKKIKKNMKEKEMAAQHPQWRRGGRTTPPMEERAASPPLRVAGRPPFSLIFFFLISKKSAPYLFVFSQNKHI
jgi:hypothetical protein